MCMRSVNSDTKDFGMSNFRRVEFPSTERGKTSDGIGL